jgi:hypothetical protein
MNKSLSIKFYGESLKIHRINLSEERLQLYNAVAKKLKQPLAEAILDIDFFRVLNVKGVETLKDITDYTFYGLINNYKSQVEVGYGRKKIAKIKVDELFRSSRLFPMFHTQISIVKTDKLKTGIYIVEHEVGLIGLYKSKLTSLNVDLLKFHLTKIKLFNAEYELLNIAVYNNQKIPCVKSDALLTTQYSFVQI